MIRGFIPPHLLERLAANPKPPVRDAAIKSLAVSAAQRTERSILGPLLRKSGPAANANSESRYVYTANHSQRLPGILERREGSPPSPDAMGNLAYDGCGTMWEFWRDVLKRSSFDDHGSPMVCTVHFGQNYDNAMWQGSQIVGGDGDGIIFRPFFSVPDVIWHEWGHAVTQYTSNLDYQDEPGGLNESFSDCHGITVLQKSLGQAAAQAEWIIGKGLFAAGIHGIGLRSMKSPGTAYDDPQLGKDPQIANYADYRPGMEVHLSSGVPNKAFCNACVLDGGNSWEKVFPVWYETNRQAPSNCTFAQWAKLTVAIALEKFGTATANAIGQAWHGVGVVIPFPPLPAPVPVPPTPPVPPVPGGQSITLAGFGDYDGLYSLAKG